MNARQFISAVLLTILAAIIIAAWSCNPMKRTQRYLFEHPEFSAEYCAEQYQAEDSVVVRDSVVFDTLTLIEQIPDADTTISGDTVTIVKTNTVYKTITKTVRKDSIVYRNNPAEERRLQLALQECQKNGTALVGNFNEQAKELDRWRRNAKIRFWWILLLIGGGITYTALRIKKSLTV